MLEAKNQGHNAKVFSKKRSSLKIIVNFPQNLRALQKKVIKMFSQDLWHAPRQNNLGPFSTSAGPVLKPRTEHFPGLAGIEAMAKNLTFKAKDY